MGLAQALTRAVERFGDTSEHVAVLAGSWGRSYLESRGVGGFHDGFLEELAGRAPEHSAPAQAAAGRALRTWDEQGLGGLSGPAPDAVLKLKYAAWDARRGKR